MTEAARIGEVDLVGEGELRELAEHREGPCVSILLPTHRAGPQTQQDPIRLRNLLATAHTELERAGLGAAATDELLAPWRALLDDAEFWRFQADGLALYAAPGIQRRYRVPLDLGEEVTVGPTFRLRPLASLAAGDGVAFVLSLSQNEVRLYEATRSTIAEVGLGSTPTSMAEALRFEDPERQLQLRPTGGDGAQFHGHGAGSEIDKQALERFFRAVNHGLESVLGRHPHPLVLAAVAYYAPIYRSVSRHPRIVEGCVEGNPEHRNPQELHAAAWPLAEPALAADREHALRRWRQAPTSRVTTDTASVLGAARDGRVDTLLLTAGRPLRGHVDDGGGVTVHDDDTGGEDLLDRAIGSVLRTGGAVHVVDPSELGAPVELAALLRF